MSEGLSVRYLMWRIVKELGLSLSEFAEMSFDMIMEAASFLDMRQDYKNAWNAYFDLEREND